MDELSPGRYWGFTPSEAYGLKMGDADLMDLPVEGVEGVGAAIGRENVERLKASRGLGRWSHGAATPQKIVQGKPLPGSKVKFIDNSEEYDNLIQEARKQGYVKDVEHSGEGLTKMLRKQGYDFVVHGDYVGGLPGAFQVVQIQPKKVLAKLGSKMKLIGAAGALGGSMGITDLLQPREAEAMPRGVYQKITQAAMSGEVSSAAKVLVGQILDGKTIKDVRKGNGNWRGLIFDDDTMMTVTNTELNDLSRAYGTKKYTSTFMQKEGPSRTEQALKSLDYHYSRVKPFITKGTTELYHQRHAERLKEMGMEPPPRGSLVSYKGRFFTMPTEYARHLEELGLLKVEKEIK